jgi:antitoxin HicB
MIGYRIKLAPDDNGTVMVTCPALPEVTTFGEDEADALRRAVGAIEEALAARMAESSDIPEGHQRGPRLVRLPALTVLKAELYRRLRETRITRAELSRRLGWKRESVERSDKPCRCPCMRRRNASRFRGDEAWWCRAPDRSSEPRQQGGPAGTNAGPLSHRRRTPGPPPFSAMNSTSAASRARRITSRVV